MRKTLIVALSGAALTLLLPTSAAYAEASPSANEQQQGGRFSVTVSGRGADLILIPGLATPRLVWDDTVAAIEGRRTVHAMQLAGFGEDAGPNAQGPILQPLIEHLAQYIRERKLDHPAIVGHSLGGLIAMKLAAEHPDLVGQIMIVDALPWFGILLAPPGSPVDATALEPQAQAMRAAIRARHETPATQLQMERELAGQVLDPTQLPRIARWSRQSDQRVVAQLAYEDMTTDMRAAIASIAVPVTVAFAWNERFPGKEQASQFYSSQYAALDGVVLRPIGPAGHFLMLDRPDEFQSVLEEFLAAQVER